MNKPIPDWILDMLIAQQIRRIKLYEQDMSIEEIKNEMQRIADKRLEIIKEHEDFIKNNVAGIIELNKLPGYDLEERHKINLRINDHDMWKLQSKLEKTQKEENDLTYKEIIEKLKTEVVEEDS